MERKVEPACGGSGYITTVEDEKGTTEFFTLKPFANIATKHDQGKPRTDLLPPDELLEIASVFGFGAKKYSDKNYLGLDPKRIYASCLRHLLAHYSGIEQDEESGYSHLAHAACCVLMLMEIRNNKKYHNNTI
jgi:hypothetical protein